MRCAIAISLLALLSISIPVLPQGPATSATGSIEGIVVRSDNGAPVAGVQITLTTAPLAGSLLAVTTGILTTLPGAVAEAPTAFPAPAQALAQAQGRPTFQPVVTGADGKFIFKDLPTGTYRIAATADGFVRQEFGQRTVNGQGRPVFVTAGQALKDATIRLIATGTVSGRVYDENGQVATGAPVQVLRAVYGVQGRNFQFVATGMADDRGEYRVFGVPPGRYYLLAGTPPGGLAARGLAGRPSTTRFSMVYYPNAENIDQALPLEVRSNSETSVDMRLRRQLQTYRVRGRIIDGTGTGLPANLGVALAYRFLTSSGSFGGGARVFDPATSTFELQNVAPGDYFVSASVPPTAAEFQPIQAGVQDLATLIARQALQAARPSGMTAVQVVDKDVEGVVVTLSTGVSTTGRLTVEGHALSSIPNLDRMRFGLQPVTPMFNQTPPVVSPPASDGTFQVTGLREGEYRAQFPAGAATGLYVKSITFGGDDILNGLLKFSASGAGTFDVVLRSGASQLVGVVTDAKSQPVPGIQAALIPSQRTRTDLYRTVITDQSGRFTMPNVPPGNYKVFSWEAIDNAAYFDPDVLEEYEHLGKAVVVTEGSSPNVDVKLIPAAP